MMFFAEFSLLEYTFFVLLYVLNGRNNDVCDTQGSSTWLFGDEELLIVFKHGLLSCGWDLFRAPLISDICESFRVDELG